MKILSFSYLLICFCSFSCKAPEGNEQVLKVRIDSLQNKLADVYKPGLGEFMSSIQIHHAKLWFAGKNQNWDLADFEIHEILETIDDIEIYSTDRKESKSIRMIQPAIDSVIQAIAAKNSNRFEHNYILLTNTCNTCHKAVDFGFNIVKVPDSPPFSNQSFEVIKKL